MDLVIDYQILHDAAAKIDALESEIGIVTDHAQGHGLVPATGGNVVSTSLGAIGMALEGLYVAWAGPLRDAGTQIQQLSTTFRSIAQVYFDADATQAGAVQAGIAMSDIRDYPQEYAQYEQALAAWEQLDDPNHVPYYTADGQEHWMSVPRPTPPPVPGTTSTGPTGATTTVQQGGIDQYDPNHGPQITSETTTYSQGGQTYSETTTFGPDQGWHDGPVQNTTTTISHADGSQDTITTTYNMNGSATTTDVNTANGTSTTTTQTRTGWDAPWQTPPTDNGNTDTTTNSDANTPAAW